MKPRWTKRRVRKVEITERTAFAYIRCAVTEEWDDEYAKLESRLARLSRSTKNRLAYDQHNHIRRFAKERGYELGRRFFEIEGWMADEANPTSLEQREKLAELLFEAVRRNVRIVLVDDRTRLDEDVVVRSELCRVFLDCKVKVYEAKTGSELHPLNQSNDSTPVDSSRLRAARVLVGRWKSMVTRLRSNSRLGRKPFGAKGQEGEAIEKIRVHFRRLPKSKWRNRRGVILMRRSFREIANLLNLEGVPTRTGRPWSATVVRGILVRLKLWTPNQPL